MARQPNTQQLFDALLDRYGERIARAFVTALDDLATNANLQRLVAAIESGSFDQVIASLSLEPGAYDPVLEEIRAGYIEGGDLATGRVPALATSRFSVRNLIAERWLAEQSSTLVREIIEDQRDAVRQALTAGMERGENPRATALDIVGRLDRTTGKREGGILGLTSQQETFARNARAELESGDPTQLRAYLDRARRNKTFDRTIQKAIESGKPVPADTIRKATQAYRSRLLALRGDMIGRTEALTALRAANHEAWRQAVEAGKIVEADVTRTWRDASDMRVRHSHRMMDGQIVRGLTLPFRSPLGATLLYPGDPSAPAGERIGCRCVEEIRVRRSVASA